MMEAKSPSETSVNYQITRRNNPEDSYLDMPGSFLSDRPHVVASYFTDRNIFHNTISRHTQSVPSLLGAESF
jgi:hypothetical protein